MDLCAVLFLLITSHKVTLCEPHSVCGFSEHFSFDFPVTLFCCVALNVTVVDSRWNSCTGKRTMNPKCLLEILWDLTTVITPLSACALKIWNVHCRIKLFWRWMLSSTALDVSKKCFHFCCCGTFQRAILSAVRMDWKPFTSMQYPAQKACLCNMSIWQCCHHSTRHPCFPAIQV